MRIITLVSATIISAGLSAQALSAGPASQAEQLTRTVRFGDLDLSRPEGAETLYQRIKEAARSVCGQPSHATVGLASLEGRTRMRACIDQATDDAVGKVNHPQLVALNAAEKQQASRQKRRRA